MKYFKLDNIENWGSAILNRNGGGETMTLAEGEVAFL